jgi:hypothetical protein
MDKALADKYRANVNRLAKWWNEGEVAAVDEKHGVEFSYIDPEEVDEDGIYLYPAGRTDYMYHFSAEEVANAVFNEKESTVTFNLEGEEPFVLLFIVITQRKLFDPPPKVVIAVGTGEVQGVYAEDKSAFDAAILVADTDTNGKGEFAGGAIDICGMDIESFDAMGEELAGALDEWEHSA